MPVNLTGKYKWELVDSNNRWICEGYCYNQRLAFELAKLAAHYLTIPFTQIHVYGPQEGHWVGHKRQHVTGQAMISDGWRLRNVRNIK